MHGIFSEKKKVNKIFYRYSNIYEFVSSRCTHHVEVVIEKRIGYPSSNPEQGYLHFT